MGIELNNNGPLSPVGAKLLGADAAGNAGWLRHGRRVKSGRLIRVATFGDSTAAIGDVKSVDGTTVPDVSEVNVPLPLSGTTSLVFGGQGKNSFSLFAPEARIVWNGGVSGENTTQMLARDAAAYSVGRRSITDLIIADPDVVILRAGSINDVTGLTAATGTQELVDAIFNRHVQIISRIMLSGAVVIDEGIFGYSAAVAADDLAYRRAVLVELNNRYAALVDTFGADRYVFLSPIGVLSDSAGAYLPGVSSDGTHISAAEGSLRLGRLEAGIIQSIFGNTARDTSLQNLFTNPVFSSTSAQSYGSTATGISVYGTNKTRANAEIAIIDGIPFALVDATGGAAGTIQFAPSDQISGESPSVSVVVGDALIYSANIYVKNLGESSQTITITANYNFYHTDGRRINLQHQEVSFILAAGAESVLKFEFPPFVSPIASADIKNTSGIAYNVQSADTGDFRAGIGAYRLCKIAA